MFKPYTKYARLFFLIEIMGCSRRLFQELYKLRHQLKQPAQEERDAKWTDLLQSCEVDKRVHSLI